MRGAFGSGLPARFWGMFQPWFASPGMTPPYTVGYDQGAIATRAAGEIDDPSSAYLTYNYVQGLNGPAGYNTHLAGTDAHGVYSTYYVTPPRTYGVELHYKFW